MSGPYRLPGGRIAAERLRHLPRTALGAGWLLGPAAWAAIARARLGDARSAEAAWARQAAAFLGMRLEVTGQEHIDPDQRYVVASLHEGFTDAVALLHLPLRMRFVARDELCDWALLGSALRSGGHVVVTPELPVAAYREILQRGRYILESESLVVFPQGTLLGIETSFSSGAFRLAHTLDRPLLPVVITGTHRVWEHPFSPTVRFGRRVRLQVLPPVTPEQAEARHREIERHMKRLALSADPPPRRYVPERDGWWAGYSFDIDPDFPELAARVAEHRAAALSLR